MILSRNRVRAVARPWRYLVAPAGLIAFVAWILIPVASVKSGLAQSQFSSVTTPVFEVVENNVKQIVTFHNDGQQGFAKPPVARKALGDKEPGQTTPAPPAPSTVSAGAESVPQSVSEYKGPPEGIWSFFARPNGEDETRHVHRMIGVALNFYNSRSSQAASVLESALDDDYFGIDPKGVVYNKAQQLEALKNRKPDSGWWGETNLKVSINGDLAVGYTDYPIHPFNGDKSEEYRFTVTLVRREKQWKVLSIHASQKQ